jgi:hypothetical protein
MPEHAGGLPFLHACPKSENSLSNGAARMAVGTGALDAAWLPIGARSPKSFGTSHVVTGESIESRRQVTLSSSKDRSGGTVNSDDTTSPAVRYCGSPEKLFRRLEVVVSRASIHVLECYEFSYGYSQEDCALRDYR